MDRRTVLASLGAASAGALAGCTVPSGRTRLDDPTVRPEDGETHLIYRTDAGRVATTTVQYGPLTDQGLLRMRLSVWHRDGTTVEDLSVTVRSRDPPTPPPEIYLSAPSGSFPPVHFSRPENGDGRRFAVPNIGEVGTGTVTIEWYLRSYDETWPVELAVDVAYALDSGLIGGYDVEGTVTFEYEQRVTFA